MTTHEMLPWQHDAENEIAFGIDRFGATSLLASGWTALTGASPEDAIGHPFADLFHPSDRLPVLEALQALIGGEMYSCRVPARCLRRDALHCWVEIYAHPTLDADGRIDGARGTLADITDRRTGMRALRESEARFRAISEASPLGVFVTDPGGGCIFANANFERICGLRADQMRGAGHVSALHPEDRARALEARETAERNRTPYGADCRYLRADGSIAWTRVNGAPILDGRSFLGVVHVVEDITDRKHLEARQAEFMATVSHELRTPLASVLGALEILREDYLDQLPEDARRFIEMALRNGNQLAGLINSVLDLERIETGVHGFDFATVPVQELLARAAQINEAFGLRLAVRLEVEQPDIDCYVWTDMGRALQILTNLISNAVKFSPAGKSVRLSCTCSEDRAQLFVEDQGPGIAEDSHSRIFQRFGQASNQEHARLPGSGLGLSICKALATRMGGDIGLRSRVGGGSAFWVELPRAKPPGSDREA